MMSRVEAQGNICPKVPFVTEILGGLVCVFSTFITVFADYEAAFFTFRLLFVREPGVAIEFE